MFESFRKTRVIFFVALSFLLSSVAVAHGKRVFPTVPKFSEPTASVSVFPEKVVPNSAVRISFQRSDWIGHSVHLHYGFNGWSLQVPGFKNQDFEGRTDWFQNVSMSWDGNKQSFFADIVVPEKVRAMHFDFCWDDCASGKWDDNGGLDYAWPLVFPYAGPYLTWNDKTTPENGIVVSFEDPSARAAWLEIWKDGVSKRDLLRDNARGIHHFVLSNLEMGTRYHYRVGIGDAFVSSDFSFKTHNGSESFSFVAMSDIQDGGGWCGFPNVRANLAAQNDDVLFYILAGDFVWNNHPGLWWLALDGTRDLFATHVVMPVPGNHDTPTTNSNPDISVFKRYFDLPYAAGVSGAYKFSVGSSLFLSMNSESPEQFAQGGVQFNWMAKQLREHHANFEGSASAGWSFAYWHIPVWDVALRHASQQYQFRPAAELFPGTLDWHFAGHEHMYQRMKPIGHGGYVQPEYGLGANGGTGYMVLPSAGAYPEAGFNPSVAPYAFVGYSGNGGDSGNGFVRVDVQSGEARLLVYQLRVSETASQMRLVDQVSIRK